MDTRSAVGVGVRAKTLLKAIGIASCMAALRGEELKRLVREQNLREAQELVESIRHKSTPASQAEYERNHTRQLDQRERQLDQRERQLDQREQEATVATSRREKDERKDQERKQKRELASNRNRSRERDISTTSISIASTKRLGHSFIMVLNTVNPKYLELAIEIAKSFNSILRIFSS